MKDIESMHGTVNVQNFHNLQNVREQSRDQCSEAQAISEEEEEVGSSDALGIPSGNLT